MCSPTKENILPKTQVPTTKSKIIINSMVVPLIQISVQAKRYRYHYTASQLILRILQIFTNAVILILDSAYLIYRALNVVFY